MNKFAIFIQVFNEEFKTILRKTIDFDNELEAKIFFNETSLSSGVLDYAVYSEISYSWVVVETKNFQMIMEKKNIRKVLKEILSSSEVNLLVKNSNSEKEVIKRMNESYLIVEQSMFLIDYRHLKQFQV